MIFDSWPDFWHMNGYAPYVWSAYGIALSVLAANIILPVLAHRRIKRRIQNGEFQDD